MNGFERWVQDVAGGLRRASSISSAGHSRSSAWKKNLDLLTSAVDADERQQLHFWELAETDIPTFAYFLKDPGALEAVIWRVVAYKRACDHQVREQVSTGAAHPILDTFSAYLGV